MSFRYILFQSIPNKEFISVSYIPLVFDFAVYLFAYLQLQHAAGEGLPVGLGVAGYLLHYKSLAHKAVEGVQIFLQTYGGVAVIKIQKSAYYHGAAVMEGGQHYINFSPVAFSHETYLLNLTGLILTELCFGDN